MADVELIWEEPPATRGAGGKRTDPGVVTAIVDALRSRPGEWLRYPDTFRRAVPQGLTKAFKAYGVKTSSRQIEPATEAKPAVYGLYLCYEG